MLRGYQDPIWFVLSTQYLVLSTAWLLLLGATIASADDMATRTIHVSPAGSDKAAGTADKPLKSLEKALEFASECDTIELAAGKYDGEVKT